MRCTQPTILTQPASLPPLFEDLDVDTVRALPSTNHNGTRAWQNSLFAEPDVSPRRCINPNDLCLVPFWGTSPFVQTQATETSNSYPPVNLKRNPPGPIRGRAQYPSKKSQGAPPCPPKRLRIRNDKILVCKPCGQVYHRTDVYANHLKTRKHVRACKLNAENSSDTPISGPQYEASRAGTSFPKMMLNTPLGSPSERSTTPLTDGIEFGPSLTCFKTVHSWVSPRPSSLNLEDLWNMSTSTPPIETPIEAFISIAGIQSPPFKGFYYPDTGLFVPAVDFSS